MKKTEIRQNLAGLEKWKKQIGNSMIARVGILGDKAQRQGEGGINNAELGLIHMLGSVSNNIPPRDWLQAPIIENKRELVRSMQTGSPKAAFDRGDYKKVFQFIGIKAEEFVQRAFETAGFGKWPPLKAATIRRKGSDKPLIDTSQLRRAVTSDVVSKSTNTGINTIEVQ